MTVPAFGFRTEPGLRTLPRARMVEQLMLWGWAYEVRAGAGDAARAAAEAALERWIGLGVGFERGADGERLFDPVEVMNAYVAMGHDGDDDFWADRYAATARRLVRDLAGVGASEVPAAAALGARRFKVRLERSFDLSGLAPGARLRLRAPAPLEDAALRDLEISVQVPDGAVFARQPGRLDASLVRGEAGTATLAFDATFTAHPTAASGGALSDAERALWLKPSEGLIQVTDRIQTLAARIAAHLDEPLAKALALHDHVTDAYRCGVAHYHQLPAAPTEGALDSGWYDCQLGAALFCTLCRAQGLPARLVSGFQLYAAISAHHYWAEVWVGGQGWTPFDLAAWHLSLGGRDDAWRGVYAGAIDYRMKVQVFPNLFTGPSTVRFPPRWRMVTRAAPQGGVEMSYEDIDTGALAWRDRFEVLG